MQEKKRNNNNNNNNNNNITLKYQVGVWQGTVVSHGQEGAL